MLCTPFTSFSDDIFSAFILPISELLKFAFQPLFSVVFDAFSLGGSYVFVDIIQGLIIGVGLVLILSGWVGVIVQSLPEEWFTPRPPDDKDDKSLLFPARKRPNRK